MSDSTYLEKVSSRIVRMFELYISKINPEDRQFQQFISRYVTTQGVKDPEAITYSELYKVVRNGIREYVKQVKERPGN